MSSNSSGFLYRRLAKFVPCVLPGIGEHGLPLATKYDVASARDVFFSAHYWRLFEFLKTEPQLVVDLGAHCGHFSVLCHLMLIEKFQRDTASYLLVEPVASLVERATDNLRASGILERTQFHCGLVGLKGGHGVLHSNSHNLLASAVEKSVPASSNSAVGAMPYLDLNRLLPGTQPIDVLKIDIEGSEHELLAEYPELLARTRILLIELHGDEAVMERSHRRIVEAGLAPVSTPIRRAAEVMSIYVASKP
jgi:FkbM family methyltransferase